MQAKIKEKTPFRVASANKLYAKMATDSDVYEYGIDTNGNIYFAYLNGIIKRYSRRSFIQMSRS